MKHALHKTEVEGIVYDTEEKNYYNRGTDIYLSEEDIETYNLKPLTYIYPNLPRKVPPGYFTFLGYAGTTLMMKECLLCKTEINILVRDDDYKKWVKDTLIQDAFPYLLNDERELLISRICGTCFDKQLKQEI